MVVILGYRRQRNFERVFFFLCLALFVFYAGLVLALNWQIHSLQHPSGLNQFGIFIISAGLCMLPALLLHLHMEYAETRGMLRVKRWKWAVLFLFYALSFHLAYHRIPLLLQELHFNFVVPGSSLGEGFAMVLGVALAWCYLTLVRRVGTWLERLLPPEASASILLFVLVIFIEPLQRVLGRRLQETAHREMDRVQRLTAEIQQEARQGNLESLRCFIERRTKEEFELASTQLRFLDQSEAILRPFSEEERRGAVRLSLEDHFHLRQVGELVGALHSDPHGAAISGDTRAALSFFCEPLPRPPDLR